MDTSRYTSTGLSRVLKAQGRRSDWLATKVGVSKALISHLLTGRRTVSLDVAQRIADALDVPADLIFEPVTAPEPVEAAA